MARTTPTAALQQAIEIAGGQSAIARALGIKQPSVSTWELCPVSRVLAVEKLTGVSRELLRPDIYPPNGKG